MTSPFLQSDPPGQSGETPGQMYGSACRSDVARKGVSANGAGQPSGLESPGVVESVLPRALYQVRLDDGRRVRAALMGAGRHGVVRLIEGSRVLVKLSAHDPARGRILCQL